MRQGADSLGIGSYLCLGANNSLSEVQTSHDGADEIYYAGLPEDEILLAAIDYLLGNPVNGAFCRLFEVAIKKG